MKRIALLAIAHGRSGDKGDAVNIGIIARRPEWYDFIRSELEAYRVSRFLRHMATGPVERYELPKLHSINFLVEGALLGGGSVGLKIDAQGKTFAHALLRYPVAVTSEFFAEIERHWEGRIPRECFFPADVHWEQGEAPVLVERHGRVLGLTLNRAARRNAITLGMLNALAHEIRTPRLDPSFRDKVILLAGAGAGFCAGMDLKELAAIGPTNYQGYLELAQGLHDALRAMITSPIPVVSAIQGDAMGGGAAFALASDIVVAEANARFAFPETKIGFIPGMVSALATRRMPALAARELLLTGRVFDAREARQLGLVHQIVERDAAGAARELANGLVKSNSVDAMARSKALMNATIDATLLAELQSAVTVFAGVATMPAFQAGMKAFGDKRVMDWTNDIIE